VTDHLLDRGHTQPRSLIKVAALLIYLVGILALSLLY
jgi:hypothetical protein